MTLSDLKEVSENINMDDYLDLYTIVRENMEHPNWLGTFEREDIEKILQTGGKIWLYYDNDIPVCSMFYIPASNKSLKKHNIEYDEKVTGSLGPIMVRKEYIGNGFQRAMLEKLNKYVETIGKKHIFTKAHADNIYSINNFLKDGYIVVNEYENERGKMKAFIK